ncbi:MAG: hypothetical protein WC824_11565, partial [Bacteroidota bacterium]
GSDGTIWGGEFLVGNSAGFIRAGHFATLPMPGGERAAREPWRMAYAAMQELHDAAGGTSGAEQTHAAPTNVSHGMAGPAGFAEPVPTEIFPAWFARRGVEEIAAVRFALQSGTNTPRTSSCGRLFDAVASLTGLYDSTRFEAQAAIALEFASRPEMLPPYSFDLQEGTPNVLSFLPTIQEIIHDMRIGKSAAEVSNRFHATMIEGCSATVDRISASTGIRTVALSGGSFQNAILLRGLIDALHNRNYSVLTHAQVPSNDGGIALGQAVIAHTKLKD